MLSPVGYGPFTEGKRASDLILPQSTLGLVNAQTICVTGWLEVEMTWATLFIQTVAGFVKRAVERAERFCFIIPSCPSNIVWI